MPPHQPATFSPEQQDLRATLRSDLHHLASDIGPRNAWHPEALERAARFIEEELAKAGLSPSPQTYDCRGQTFRNIEAEIPGTKNKEPLTLLGAHYDSVAVPGCAGANDNGSGVVACLALARRFARTHPERTLRFLFFANEEPPFFGTKDMGSRVYAARCRARGESVSAMLSIETIGYYSGEKGSQRYPPLVRFFYPDTGNFLAFVGNLASRALMKRALAAFRRRGTMPAEGAALPWWLPGVWWSDHWSFWKEGYPALMVTDTAPYRYPHYHTAGDTVDEVDFDGLTRAVLGLHEVARDLAGA